MLHKRISAVALSFLLAISPMAAPLYGSTAFAAETEMSAADDETPAAQTEISATDDEALVPGGETVISEAASTETVTEDSAAADDDTPANEDTPDDPDTPGTPGTTADPDTPGNPDMPGTPGTPADPDTPDDPGTPGDPDEPDDPGIPAESPCADGAHTWDAGVMTSEPSCTEEGQQLFTCTECGETRTEAIPAAGHSFGDWTVVTAPTTRKDGLRERKCSACGEVESEVMAHTILKVKTIGLSKSSAALLTGRGLQLRATPAPANATSTKVTWKSSNTSVATVSAAGKVTAKKPGKATILCIAADGGGAKASCVITVKQAVGKISLSRTSLSLNKGKAIVLKATVSPASAANKAVTWKSSNTKVAAVTSAGRITAKAKGTAVITCTARDGSGTKATCKVTVKIPVAKIRLSKSSASLVKGKSLTLRAVVGPASASNKTVSWKSSNTRVATVSSTGKVTAKGKGTANIICTARDGSKVRAICKVTVKAPASVRGSGGSGSGASAAGGYVWLSATGTKYHRHNNCGTMNPNKATKVSVAEAKRRGMTPCKKCFP